jgi:hypothetical protein
LTFISSCSTTKLLNKLSKDHYTFVLNEIDTIKFEKLFLDNNLEQKIEVDRKNKLVKLNTVGDLEQIVSIDQIEEMYSRDSIKVAFVIYDGDIYGTSISNEKVFFQYS